MNKKEQVQMILEEFDFKSVQDTLVALKRPWKQGNEIPKIPTIEEIKNMAEYILTKVANSSDETAYYEIYGLEAEKIQNTLELRYVVARCNPLLPLLNPDFKNGLARKA